MREVARYIVKVKLPNGVTKKDMEDYIRKAVRIWCGGLDPQNPLFDLVKEDVTVIQLNVK